jgi:hypothetical protein
VEGSLSDTLKSVKVAPSVVDGGISRIVGNGSEVWAETWDPNARSWVEGGAMIGEVIPAPPASAERMDALGLPKSERG